jgi:hypothetical protein
LAPVAAQPPIISLYERHHVARNASQRVDSATMRIE